MEFKKNQTIYMQIADFVKENILQGQWPAGEKIASVREMAANIQVNPNTVMRTYTLLQDEGIITNKRGIGYFVSVDAETKIRDNQKAIFLQEDVPEFFRKMRLLNIELSELETMFKKK